MSECTHDCSTCGEDCSSRKSANLKKPLHEGSVVKKVIAVVSGKGGVGKSMTTAMLACCTVKDGYETAILDADITGPSIPKMFGVTDKAYGYENTIFPVVSEEGIQMMSMNLLLEEDSQPVIWRGSLISGAAMQFWTDVAWENVDYMYVDMPPGTGDVPLSIFQSLPLAGIVIVTTPQDLVKMIVEKAVNMAKMMNVPILGIVENMSYLTCPECGKKIEIFGRSKVDEIAKEFNIPAVAKLPIDPSLAEKADAGMIYTYETDAFNAIIDEIRKV